ncbi:MAG: hypothetical protein WBK99_10000 [Solirubrobacterales bacterium]
MATSKPDAGTAATPFWPQLRWVRATLLLAMAFAALQGVLVASSVPPWWGPDEDYHWGYASYIDERGSLPNPRKPFYSKEWNKAIVAMNFNQFGQTPGTTLTGDPHRVTGLMDRLPASARQPTGEPTRPVMHAPLFHSLVAVAVKPFAGSSVFTRLWIGRLVNAFFAALAVFAAWLLASSIFSRAGPRLFVAGLTAVQPMIAYASGTLTNDMPMIAFFTVSLAAMSMMLRGAPSPRQGRFLGLAIGLAMLAKATAIFLVPFALAIYAWQWRAHPTMRKQLRSSLLSAAAIAGVIAGWFYVYMIVKYQTLLGNLGPLNNDVPAAPQSIVQLPKLAFTWFSQTYSTYWSHYIYWEGPRGSVWFWVPVMIGGIGLIGFASWIHRVAIKQFDSQIVRQVMLLVGAVILLVMPFFLVDMRRGLDGNGFMVNGGRFMLPAYPAAACLLVIALNELFRPSAQRLVFAAVAGLAAIQGLMMWKIKVLDRYFGGVGVDLQGELHRASFYRPEFITNETLSGLIALVLVVGFAAFAVGVSEGRAPRGINARWRGPRPPRAR